MANLDNLRGDGEQALPGFIATWTETTNSNSGSAVASHAAEAGRSHYLCGIAFSCQSQEDGETDEMTAEILDGTTSKFKISFGSHSVGTDATNVFSDGQVIVHNFTTPILITENALVSLTVAGNLNYARAYASIWGFSNETRVE